VIGEAEIVGQVANLPPLWQVGNLPHYGVSVASMGSKRFPNLLEERETQAGIFAPIQ
jgi:hypothetical protein